MNKKTLLIGLIALISITATSQETQTNNHNFGIYYSSFGENDALYFTSLEGAASYRGDGFFAIGTNYLKPINKLIELETGVEYSYHKLTRYPNVPPGQNNEPEEMSATLLSIPVGLRLNFLKYLFLSTAASVDVDLSNPMRVDNQTGLGLSIGLGLKYEFINGLSIYANPYIESHGIINFSDRNHPLHLYEQGVRFGVMYRL